MSSRESHNFVVLGAGVIGLTTTLCLRSTYPSASIQLVATHFPGDYHVDYASPWAGGNWCSAATDNGLLESFDHITYKKFEELARQIPEAGIAPSPLRMIFDQNIEDAEILSQGTGKVWYDELVGGLGVVPKNEVPEGAMFGLDMKKTFVINTQVYLRWLLARCQDADIQITRQKLSHIDEAGSLASESRASAIFNCTGLGSFSLGGVEDSLLYPTRGQTVLVEQPLVPLTRMYFRSPRRVDKDTTYVFQRPLAGGVVLGGCRENGNWDGTPDAEFAKDIMQRCCRLAPELGRPEDLKVIKHGVGLRPSRKGGPRIEVEMRRRGELLVVHNYGASGAGYQASWGMAMHGVKLFAQAAESANGQAKL